MSIKVNGTDIGSSIKLNNTDLSEIIFNGTSVWKAIPAWDTRGLDYNSWETIQKYIQAGLFGTVANVGETKSFVMNGKTYHAEVVAINDGTGSAGQWYPDKTVDFICVELYQTANKYNAYPGSNAYGFPSSALNRTLNNIYSLLPEDLKNVIVDKSHSYQVGSYSSYKWISEMGIYSSKLWVPTYFEIAGSTNSNAPGEDATNNKAYTLASKKKQLNGGSYSDWWTSSPHSSNGQAVWYFYNRDRYLSYAISDYDFGIPICFRIG